jgi:hypothetical protein
MHEKRSTRFLVLTRAGGNHLGGKGTTAPISLKIIGASTGISNQPSTNTTLGIYQKEKTKKQES